MSGGVTQRRVESHTGLWSHVGPWGCGTKAGREQSIWSHTLDLINLIFDFPNFLQTWQNSLPYSPTSSTPPYYVSLPGSLTGSDSELWLMAATQGPDT